MYVLLSCRAQVLTILLSGKKYLYTIWASKDVLGHQTDWVSALARSGGIIENHGQGANALITEKKNELLKLLKVKEKDLMTENI